MSEKRNNKRKKIDHVENEIDNKVNQNEMKNETCSRCKIDQNNRKLICKSCYDKIKPKYNDPDDDSILLEQWNISDKYDDAYYKVLNHFTNVDTIQQDIFCMGHIERLKFKSDLIQIISDIVDNNNNNNICTSIK